MFDGASTAKPGYDLKLHTPSEFSAVYKGDMEILGPSVVHFVSTKLLAELRPYYSQNA